MRFLKKKYSNEELLKHYEELYAKAKSNCNMGLAFSMARTMVAYKPIYEKVSAVTKHKVPWEIIACIHALETNLNFNLGLHSGEPWDEKTKKVPKGKGPFASWEDAAVDALNSKPAPIKYNLFGWLHWLEGFNGYGYLWYHPEVNSPYLWAGTTEYSRGKYTADGKFDKNAVSKQLGAVLLLKTMVEVMRSMEEVTKQKKPVPETPVKPV